MSDVITINVTEDVEEVTINVTESVDEVEINVNEGAWQAVDSALSETSTNPLTNAKLFELFQQLAPSITITEIEVTWE